MELAEELARAVDITRAAGELTLRWFQSADLTVERKRDGTPVTEADRAAELYIRAELQRQFPLDSIIGEEHDYVRGTSGRTWYIDPIDGTKAFSRGVPLYSNLLALIDPAGAALGVINLPALSETVYAARGLGCFHNGARCGVSATAQLDGAYVTTSALNHWPGESLANLQTTGAVLRTWGDGYGYALVATGRVDVMVDPVVEPYDVAPMPVILAEAGGRFTDWSGNHRHDGGSGVATNGLLHADVLAHLRADG